MYFGKQRARWINLFWSRWILLMIVPDVVMVEREPYSKISRAHCLQICNMVDGLVLHFLLTKSLIRWYLVLRRARVSSKCFWKVNLESKVSNKKFTWGQILSLSPYSFRMSSEFLAREGQENMMALVFSGFSFILLLALHFASFHRSLRKSFAANCTFLLAAHRAVPSAN